MDETTIARLAAVNRDFYRRRAAAFDETRRAPWPGWGRVSALLATTERASILDVGCGNGRFGAFLDGRLRRPLDYVGVDSSRELLRLAAGRAPAGSRFVEADLSGPEPLAAVEREGGAGFDLVAGFGLMHHLPGEATRRRVLEAMAARVAPGGHLAVSFWQFGERARFRDRALDWGGVGLTGERVERNDFLLPWGATDDGEDGGPGAGAATRVPRYCHYADRAEARRLVAGLELVLRDEYRSDGRSGDLNLYLLLARPAAPG